MNNENMSIAAKIILSGLIVGYTYYVWAETSCHHCILSIGISEAQS